MPPTNTWQSLLSRRELLKRSGMGFGMLGLAGILSDDDVRSASAADTTGYQNPLSPKQPHFPAKAKRVDAPPVA